MRPVWDGVTADTLVGGEYEELGSVVAELGKAEGAVEGKVQKFSAGLVEDGGLVAAVVGADGLRGGIGGDDRSIELAELDACLERVDDGAVVAGGEVEEVAEPGEAVDAFVCEWYLDHDLGTDGAVLCVDDLDKTSGGFLFDCVCLLFEDGIAAEFLLRCWRLDEVAEDEVGHNGLLSLWRQRG